MSSQTINSSQPVVMTGGGGYDRKITAWCLENGVEISRSKARRLGERMYRRAQQMQTEFDFYESMRVLGIFKDETARDAIRSMEREQQCQ